MMKRKHLLHFKLIQWITAYLLVLLTPLYLVLLQHEQEWRGFWIEFGVGLGIVGFTMMCAQFLLTGRFKRVAGFFGSDAILIVHRYAGIISYFFIVGHFIILSFASPEYASYFHPGDNWPRALALSTAVGALSIVIITSVWREKLRLSYEWWLMIHGPFSLLVVMIGLVHLLMVGFYVDELWLRIFWISMALISLFLIIYIRVIKPILISRRPYKVVEVTNEAEGVWTVTIEAVGHSGMKFKAGQFARLLTNYSPFTLEQNPFSIASSDANPARLAFTIKELGDFAASIKELNPGDRVYVEGPHGAFTLKTDPEVSMTFIMGGIGVTPAMSMLRTMSDRNDQRQVTMLYANKSEEDVSFKSELDQLEKKLNLKVVHVMESLPDGWTGEEGRIDKELLEKYRIPGRKVEYYICGPGPLMDVAETIILEWGVPPQKIHSERFQIV